MADRLYLPPSGDEIRQGDLFRNMPSVYVASRPLRVARGPWSQNEQRETWGVHREDGPPPKGGFKWRIEQDGEPAVLVHGYLGLAMVMSHECEIENDPNARTLAMVRPADHLDDATRAALFSGAALEGHYGRFPLQGQEEDPRLAQCYVDFRRLTTVRPALLEPERRIASLSDELRDAVAEAFHLYLFRPIVPSGE